MHVFDAVAIALLLAAVGAVGFGEAALVRADDVEALYWFAAGLLGLRAAVQFGKAGKP